MAIAGLVTVSAITTVQSNQPQASCRLLRINCQSLIEVISRVAVLVGAPIIAITVRPFDMFVVTTIGAIWDIVIIVFIMAVAVPAFAIPIPVTGVVPALESIAGGAGV